MFTSVTHVPKTYSVCVVCACGVCVCLSVCVCVLSRFFVDISRPRSNKNRTEMTLNYRI